MSSIHVRATEPTDIEAIHAIFSCPGVIAQTLQLPYQSRQQVGARFVGTSTSDYRLVAELDGRVVGTLGLHVETRPRRRHSGTFGMAVHDDFHNRAIGSAMMAAMLNLADSWLNLHRIALEVFVDNLAAIHLYEKFGFVTEGTMRDFALRDGQFVDALLMARIRG